MVSRDRSVYQTSYHMNCEALRTVLRAAMDSCRGDRSALGSVPCRAVAALYMLLLGHPVDRRGRCRSCRRPGAVFGRRWRRCRVHGEASMWLHQPATFLCPHLARELELVSTEPLPSYSTVSEDRYDSAASAAGRDEIDVLPRMAPDPIPLTTPRTPAVQLPGGFPRAARSGADYQHRTAVR